MIYTNDNDKQAALDAGKKLYQCCHCMRVYDDNTEKCPGCGALHEAGRYTRGHLNQDRRYKGEAHWRKTDAKG
jgi:hypothetical protein